MTDTPAPRCEWIDGTLVMEHDLHTSGLQLARLRSKLSDLVEARSRQAGRSDPDARNAATAARLALDVALSMLREAGTMTNSNLLGSLLNLHDFATDAVQGMQRPDTAHIPPGWSAVES